MARATGYLAGSDERRADELNGLLRDPDVRAILLARGGYGIFRLLGQLDADALRRDPKPIVGFSDGTALLAWALREAGLRGIHGPTVAQLGELPAEDTAWMIDLLEGRGAGHRIEGLAPVGAPGSGRIEGALVGGNLTLLAHLVGTPWAPPLAGAILFLEEQGERPYAIDRYLTRMALAGATAGARGAVLGQLVRCVERVNPDHPTADEVIDERLRALGIPGVRGAPFGHGERNWSLPFGGRAAVDLEAGVVELVDPAAA